MRAAQELLTLDYIQFTYIKTNTLCQQMKSTYLFGFYQVETT